MNLLHKESNWRSLKEKTIILKIIILLFVLLITASLLPWIDFCNLNKSTKYKEAPIKLKS